MTRKAPVLRIALLAVLAVLVLVPSALAAKGRGGGGTTTGGTGTIDLVVLNSTDGLPHFGGKVTFNVSTSATTQPWVDLKCYQNGVLVAEQANGIFPGSLGEIFTLGPSVAWQSGAADCTAYLQNWDSYSKRGVISTLGSTSFHVYA